MGSMGSVLATHCSFQSALKAASSSEGLPLSSPLLPTTGLWTLRSGAREYLNALPAPSAKASSHHCFQLSVAFAHSVLIKAL